MTRSMTKQFAMLHATKGLEDYLSRERYNLDKMADNNRVTQSFFDSKVLHFNRLVDTLNQLFATLSDSPSSLLFDRYETDSEDEVEFHNASFTPPPNIYGQPSFAQEVNLETVATKEVTSEPLVGSVDTELSKQRAQAALDEYKETAERDVSSYLPEDDEPVDVMYTGKEEEATSDEEDISSDENVSVQDHADDGDTEENEIVEELEENYEDEDDAFDSHYYSHTVDNVPVDFSGDPTQIATVETAVERYGKESNQGADIDVSGFMYKSSDTDSSFFDNLIDSEDLADLQSVDAESDDSETDDSDEDYDEDYEEDDDMVDVLSRNEDDEDENDDESEEEFIDVDMDQDDFISHDSEDDR